MGKSKDNKFFWNKYAKFYDFEIMRFNGNAYKEMYKLMSQSLTKEMNVLEIATGTGLIAINIAEFAGAIEAIDFSPKMIETAKKKKVPKNVNFAVEDATNLSFGDNSFDAVIISNALHIMPNPEAVLSNIKRVLKTSGILIAPTYSHGHLSDKSWSLNKAILNFIGFKTYAKWTPEEYLKFLTDNGFEVEEYRLLKAAFPLMYVEAKVK